MWSWLGSFLAGPLINGLLSAYRERLKATDTQDQMALELLQKEVDADIAARSEATKLLIAEQGHWYTAVIRPLFAFPFLVFEAKVIVWDKVLGWGTTDHIDPMMWGVFNTVIVSYFGASAIERVSRIFKR